MIKLEYFVVADSVSIDRETNLVSILNVVEELRAPASGLGVLPQLTAIACLMVSPDDTSTEARAELVIEEAHVPARVFSVQCNVTKPRFRAVFRLQGLPLLGDSDLTLNLRLNGEHVAGHTITLIRTKTA